MIIIPTIIAKDFQEIEEKIRRLEPYVKWVQLDIMDGQFVENTTWNNPADLKNLKTFLNLEAHLMVENPEKVIDDWTESGVKRIIYHWEATNKHEEIVKKIQGAGLEAGIAINPETPVNVLDNLLRVTFILIMSVHPGQGGQKFLEEVLPKISEARQKYKDVKIAVDGGVNLETAPKAIEAGADILNIGNAIWENSDIADIIEKIKLCQ